MEKYYFGIKIVEGKYGFNINADNYAIKSNRSSFNGKMSCAEYVDESYKFYTDEFIDKYYDVIMENYYLNMEYFTKLDKDKFQETILNFVCTNKFIEVDDLNAYTGLEGYYIMVLDRYSQVYVGTSKSDVIKRIKAHWIKRKSFDRLLLPMWNVKNSVISIDSFRAMDTTRIYIKQEKSFNNEDYYINQLPKEFIMNRINGGNLENIILEGKGLEIKTHHLG